MKCFTAEEQRTQRFAEEYMLGFLCEPLRPLFLYGEGYRLNSENHHAL
jgi:hypothetical protein